MPASSDMFDTFIKCISVVYVNRLIPKHNLFIHHLRIRIKLLDLDIEVKSKVKNTQWRKDWHFFFNH